MKWTKEEWEKQFNESMDMLNAHIEETKGRIKDGEAVIEQCLEQKRILRKKLLGFEQLKERIIDNYTEVLAHPENFIKSN